MNIAIFFFFFAYINVINVKLCIMELVIEIYLFTPLSVILTIFQGHSRVKQFPLKVLCSYLIQLKLCMIVHYID